MKALVLLTALFALASAPLYAQDTSFGQGTSDDVFLELEQEWTDALARRDSARLASLLHPDFTLIGAGARADNPFVVDRELYLRNSMRSRWPRREVRVVDVSQNGDAAVVRCVWRGAEPPPFPTPEPEAGVYAFLLTDVWVHGADGWQVFARHSSFASAAP